MKKNMKYTDEPLGELKIIPDFLPSPENLIFKEDKIKITISLDKSSIDFFKQEAVEHNTQYSELIQEILYNYVARHRSS